MSTIRVTKEFNFEMAHALHEYNGPCKNLHGHSYKLHVCIKGRVGTQPQGMVIDFSELKRIINSAVIDKLDHSLMLNADSHLINSIKGEEPFGKMIVVPYQPTCENIILDIAEKVQNNLPDGMELHHLLLRETPSSYAEWYREDNV